MAPQTLRGEPVPVSRWQRHNDLTPPTDPLRDRVSTRAPVITGIGNAATFCAVVYAVMGVACVALAAPIAAGVMATLALACLVISRAGRS